ncbi:hypothetical protein [Streptacidiphilus sp. EB103A]|uniref:hypothetical protein n=1 Tax=Streptacidiphilus sp. EB103A TaxID=3156275 RepID=UPI003512F4D4
MTTATYRATVLLNVATDPRGRAANFDGYRNGHPLGIALAEDGAEVAFTVRADSAEGAADDAYILGNRQPLPGRSAPVDDLGLSWPGDLRSVSVGDVVRVLGPQGSVHLAVTGAGFLPVDAPAPADLVPLPGTRATSRTRDWEPTPGQPNSETGSTSAFAAGDGVYHRGKHCLGTVAGLGTDPISGDAVVLVRWEGSQHKSPTAPEDLAYVD